MKLSINTPVMVRTIMIIDVVEMTLPACIATGFELKLIILPSSPYITSELCVFFWISVEFVEEGSGFGDFEPQSVPFEGQQVPTQF